MPSLGLKLRLNKITASILKVYTTGLVLWQKMVALPYTGAERMPDSSGTGNVGEIYSGYCFDFATNDSIDVGDTEVNVKTIAFYLYADTTTQDIMELQASGAVMLDVTSGTLTATGFTSPTIYVNGVAGTSIAATTWYHVVITTATAIDANAVKFGVANGVYFNGKLTDIRFYGAELTANQVAEIYANPEKQVPAGLGNSDLVAWWPFTDVAGTTAINAVAGGLGGAINGATMEKAIPGKVPQWGLKGNSQPMVFDDNNDYIAANSMTANTQFSVSFWVTKDAGGLGYILDWQTTNDDFGILLNYATNEIRIGWLSGVLTKSNYVIPYKPFHIAATLDTSTLELKLYRNGTLFSTDTLSAATWGTTSTYWIGASSSSHGGIIFNHGNWDTILSADEIASLYAAGINHDLRTSTGNYTSTANLQGYWVNTGNTNADWVDLSGNGNDGTVNGSPVTTLLPEGLVAGKDLVGMDLKYPNNGALSVPASGYISVPDDNSLDLSTAFTIEFWLKLNKEASTGYIIRKTGSYQIYVFATQTRIYLDLTSGTIITSLPTNAGALTYDEWVHYAMTYDNVNVKHYINAVLDRTLSYTSTINNTSNALTTSFTSSQIDNGLLDSVKIYNVALTADQILQNYKAEKAAHS